jgi:lipopolysaccharide transport system permease protein
VSVVSERPKAARRRARAQQPPIVLLRPASGWGLGLAELWSRRELIYFFAWRDLKIRYKQTALGAFWAVLQPLVTMLVFSVFFGRLAKVPSSGLPYPVFTLAALVPWGFFSNSVSQAATSLVTNASLLTKIYFPRLAAPIASVLGCVVDFVVALVLFVIVAAFYGIHLGPRALWTPAFFLLAATAAVGVGTWLAAINVEFRDVKYALPFVMQVWLLATPIAYPSTLIHGAWANVYALNPMVGVIDGFRWALLGANLPLAQPMLTSTAAALALLVSGVLYFRRRERVFSDVI